MSFFLLVSGVLFLAPSAAVVVPANVAPPKTFSLRQVEPYFPTGKAQSGSTMLRLDRAAEAVPLFAEALATEKKRTVPLRFLLASAFLRAGRFVEAAKQFDELVGKYPVLADYIALGAARASLQLRRLDVAQARLATLSADSTLAAEAQLVLAELRQKQGNLVEAAELLSSYLTKYPESWRQHEIRAKLARVLDLAGKKQTAEVHWRKLYIEAAHESFGQEAAQHLVDRELSSDERQRRAMALFDGMRNPESEEEWKRLLLAEVADADGCVARYHLAQSVFKQRDRGRAAPLFDEARTICERAKNEDLLVKSIYQAGRSYGSRSKEPALVQKGMERFTDIVEHHKDHSYADDAQVRKAELAETLGRKDESRRLLAEVASLFPTGDQRGEALWRLAFVALREKDYPTADKWLNQALSEMPRQEGWWEAGRTLYWLGRTAELRGTKGDKVKSIDYYERTAREYPLTYYALFALNRLRTLGETRYRALVTRWADAPAPGDLPFAPQPLFMEPGWTRVIELLRLGLGNEAKRELYQLGLSPPGRGESVAPGDEDRLWLATALLDAAGQWSSSHAIPRYFLLGYSRAWPSGENQRRWRLSYPRGYAELVEPATRDNGFAAELEFAIMREESAFDPTMESFANAIGLTQLTAAPAARFANGLPHDKVALRVPSINVPIGARELGHLVKLYGGNLPLAIAGYNAGEGAVNRWLREPERNDGNLDLFLEAIPYDETRGYTKRVLSSYFAYAWLAGGTLDERIPKLFPQTPQK